MTKPAGPLVNARTTIDYGLSVVDTAVWEEVERKVGRFAAMTRDDATPIPNLGGIEKLATVEDDRLARAKAEVNKLAAPAGELLDLRLSGSIERALFDSRMPPLRKNCKPPAQK